ncbi:uncharacterized protein BDZ99DRAFT_426300 [Mytilinidion resinicola]|uniref:NADH-ubiquinone reductase complex 1 MLRQ subunit n=1 Tax=Mytilinidion resinicola TaxID=574789 RepID=A0A6A6Y6A1_9PEZI|nr:uncharacterized protein BDZ99DRAFT_426300 [Mytilinidion resinicola]KAF2804058.1 hypothetical protein BDZ99DRAFT_426300 [Mytilinidion resinicola]
MLRTRVLAMQPTAFMRMQPTAAMRIQPSAVMRMQPTARMMRPVPKEEHSAHTISQRIRQLKKVPPELIPLGIVLAVAIFAAGFSSVRKFYTDKTLRLSRQHGSE